MQAKQITIVRRDIGKKTAVPQSDAVAEVVNILEEIQQSLLQRARDTQDKLTTTATDMKGLTHAIEATGGFVRAFLSENNDCEDKIQQETGATVRIVPFKESAKGKCVFCGSPNSREVYFARSY